MVQVVQYVDYQLSNSTSSTVPLLVTSEVISKGSNFGVIRWSPRSRSRQHRRQTRSRTGSKRFGDISARYSRGTYLHCVHCKNQSTSCPLDTGIVSNEDHRGNTARYGPDRYETCAGNDQERKQQRGRRRDVNKQSQFKCKGMDGNITYRSLYRPSRDSSPANTVIQLPQS